jgi:PAS domain S-box-containing protein/putative nucleotidyltransferase with HDIG domain
MTSNRYLILSILAALLFWPLDAWIDASFFSEASFTDELINPFKTEIYFRLLVSLLLLVVSGTISYIQKYKRLLIQREHSVEELLESEFKFKALFQMSPDPTWIIDENDRFILCNVAAANILEYDNVEELQSIHPSELSPEFQPDGQSSLKKANEMMTCAHRKGAHRFEWEYRRRSGECFPVEVTLSYLKIKDKNHLYCMWRDISERKQVDNDLIQSAEKVKKGLVGTIVAMSKMVEARDPYTAGHQQAVAKLSRAIAQTMGLDNDQVEGLRTGALIHDIGNIHLPAEILIKPGKLTELEYELVKTHTQIGYDILKDIEFPWPVADIAHQHHERLDGSGYPQGLKGDEICLEARIIAVADVVEAMSSHRPYRTALGIDAALEEIQAHKGSLYDKEVVDACMTLFNDKKFSL